MSFPITIAEFYNFCFILHFFFLAVVGFMRPSINENTVANFGLLDQIAALHWIKENIHSFGGDKDSVTLMGHTTGAACINYLMVSPVASGMIIIYVSIQQQKQTK